MRRHPLLLGLWALSYLRSNLLLLLRPPKIALCLGLWAFLGTKLTSSAARRIEDGKDGQILVSQMGGDMTDAGSVNAFSGFGVFVVARRHVSSFGDGCQEVGNYRYEHAAREMPWGGGMRMDREDAARWQQRNGS